MKLTETQMIKIIKENKISTLSEQQKKQVFSFAFGDDYMKSKNKGSKKTYK